MPTLVLLPGMDGTGELFEPFVAALGAGWDTAVVRYPADRPLAGAQLLELARGALPPQGGFWLLGESFSGPLALRLAAEGPPGLQGLVLCASFARHPWHRAAVLARLASCWPVRALPSWALAFALMGRFETPELRARLEHAMAQVSQDVWRVRLREVLSIDVSAVLPALTLPCLYLQARHDRLVSSSAARELQRLVPRMRRVLIDAPHLLLQAAPQAAARAVEAFVAEVAASEAS